MKISGDKVYHWKATDQYYYYKRDGGCEIVKESQTILKNTKPTAASSKANPSKASSSADQQDTARMKLPFHLPDYMKANYDSSKKADNTDHQSQTSVGYELAMLALEVLEKYNSGNQQEKKNFISDYGKLVSITKDGEGKDKVTFKNHNNKMICPAFLVRWGCRYHKNCSRCQSHSGIAQNGCCARDYTYSKRLRSKRYANPPESDGQPTNQDRERDSRRSNNNPQSSRDNGDNRRRRRGDGNESSEETD